MRHIASSTTNLCVLASLATLLSGCPKPPPIMDSTLKPSDPMPLVLAVIDSATELSYLGARYAEQQSDFVTCVVGDTLAAALTTAGEGLRGNIEGTSIPGIEYDVSACLAIHMAGSEPLTGVDLPELVQPMANLVLSNVNLIIQSYKGRMKCKDKAWALALIDYTKGALPSILDEIETPDGKLSIPAAVVALDACEEVN